MTRFSLFAGIVALLTFMAGCGAEDRIGEDAAVTAYVETPLCAGANEQLGRDGAEAGDLAVRVSCLPQVRKGEKLDLSQIGANARRATEDSSSVAYVAAPDRRATDFSLPILEEADIPRLTGASGAAAISRLLNAIEKADVAGSLREAVSEELSKPSSQTPDPHP